MTVRVRPMRSAWLRPGGCVARTPKGMSMPAQWQAEPKRWRVRATASDGLAVTLGRYDTEEEAQADLARLSAEGNYRDLRVEPIAPRAGAAPGAQPA